MSRSGCSLVFAIGFGAGVLCRDLVPELSGTIGDKPLELRMPVRHPVSFVKGGM